jgi:murein L,D-transpeptidase YafK
MTVATSHGLRSFALSRSFIARARGTALAAGCAIALSGALSGCVTEEYSGFGPKHLQPLSPQTVVLIEQKGMAKDSPILLRLFKEESELEVWKQNREGRFEILKRYPICRWSGELGPKIREGDRQAPEGFYSITPELMNPRSSFYLAFNMGFPNEFDRALGRTGAFLMIHGDCSSRGCYAMTDEQIQEIFALGREAFDGGQLAFQVQAYPFRMTAANMARHRNSPHLAFWRMLKEGNDHFEISRRQPKVDVCEKRYVFDALLVDPSKPFDPLRPCPAYEAPDEIAKAVTAKKEADDREFAVLARLGVPTVPVITGRDGSMNPIYAAELGSKSDDRFVTAATPAVTGSTGSVAFARVPLPPTDPRRRSAESSSLLSLAGGSEESSTRSASASAGGFSLGRLFGFGGEGKPEPKPQGTVVMPTATPPAPTTPARAASTKAAKPKTRSVQTPRLAPQPVASATSGQSKPASATRLEPEKPAAPAPLPGATPILSSGGFSYN